MRQHISKHFANCKSQYKWSCFIKDNGFKTICLNTESFLKGQLTGSPGFQAGCLRKNQVGIRDGGMGFRRIMVYRRDTYYCDFSYVLNPDISL